MRHDNNNRDEPRLVCPGCGWDEVACQCKSGGASGGGAEEEEAKRAELELARPRPVYSEPLEDEETREVAERSSASRMEAAPGTLQQVLDVISRLLVNNLLIIDGDRESGVLSIRLACDPKSLTDEERIALNQYAGVVLKELAAFKNENNIRNNGVKLVTDPEGNIQSLQIMLSPVSLYDAFIERLSAKQLLPMQVINQHKDDLNNKEGVGIREYKQGINHFTSAPIGVKAKSTVDGKNINDENQAVESNAKFSTPFNIPSLNDGCTPDS